MSDFGRQIIDWYKENKRVLPWRSTQEPYRIWLSEIILQQTRVAQGLSYYERFVKEFPQVEDLANASEQEVLKLWQGLGYYSRARNLHFAAKQVVEDFGGVFPRDYKSIKSLKGVGDYTAAAIASFAFHLPHPVVDGNVYRLLSRYFNDDTPIDTTQGKKQFQAYADELMLTDEIADFNQAMMEMGAIVCTPKNPSCETCPLQNSCSALKEGSQLELPIKAKKVKVQDRFLHYIVVDANGYYLQQRDDKGIWRNMFEFPLIESQKEEEDISVLAKKEGFEILGSPLYETKHILSHQKLHVKFWKAKADEAVLEKYIQVDHLEDHAIPRVIDRFLEEMMEKV
ncbi:A/G-specific DNA-adenine glycosylase [Lishizhenia tianjinensis]|uniref:Adenine DNA glycosylase n=1 Tax=Lishizhenia tianjinensis TaxID=477690 RepID=A0A1I7A0G3_9FLAO|nr:A/G-specific adenine glycosylase [Lishizhenia tianjinensis]SFT68413.1 A/G-specific DNA-adenine glycosylase [Lishizhenia tianjinensis]